MLLEEPSMETNLARLAEEALHRLGDNPTASARTWSETTPSKLPSRRSASSLRTRG